MVGKQKDACPPYPTIFVFIISGCNNILNYDELKEKTTTALVYKNEIAFLPDDDMPYTGKLEIYRSNMGDCISESVALIKLDGDFKKENTEQIRTIGAKNELLTWWRKITNTQEDKCYEENYKDGKRNGLITEWHNGQKSSETNYRDNKKNGLHIG
jgi:antitoxin component YwqK of YwqJK toxin-antitoxin module